MAKRNVTTPRAVKGRLENMVEPSTGTVIWAFRKESRNGLAYGVPRPLKDGDFIQVFNDAARKQEIWSGTVELEFKSSKGPKPGCPHITAQCVKGVGAVHGVQKDTDPETWGNMFVTGKPAIFVPRLPNTPNQP